jgi:hypothetical protein
MRGIRSIVSVAALVAASTLGVQPAFAAAPGNDTIGGATAASIGFSQVLDTTQATTDADDAQLWRFSPRRLEAEVLRDAMLAVSGQLNLAAGGPSFRPFEALKFPANAYVPVDKLGAEFNRRSVYRMNVKLLDLQGQYLPLRNEIRRAIDEGTLNAVAEATGGKYYPADSAEKLNDVFAKLPTDLIISHNVVEISVAFTAIGTVLIALAILLGQAWRPLP